MKKKPFRKGGFKQEPKEFEEEVLQISRVTRVVKGGRRLRFRATVIIGDRKGRVGFGVGKSVEVAGAIQKAVAAAKKSVITIPLAGATVPHTVRTKFKSSEVMLKPASPGTGIIAGGAVRKMVELAGVKNVLSKSFGSNNKINATRATYKALTELRENPYMNKLNPTKTKKAERKGPQTEKAEKKDAPKKKAAPKKATAKKAAPKAKAKKD